MVTVRNRRQCQPDVAGCGRTVVFVTAYRHCFQQAASSNLRPSLCSLSRRQLDIGASTCPSACDERASDISVLSVCLPGIAISPDTPSFGGGNEMMRFSPVSLLFTCVAALVLNCTSNPALAQHRGKGSNGGSHGSGSHGGSSRSGGRSHSGGGGHIFHGGGGSQRGDSHARGHFHSSSGGSRFRGGTGFHAGGGSHGSGSAHIFGRNFRSGVPAGPPQRGGGSPGTASALDHRAGSSSSNAFGAHGSANSDGQWHSFGSRGNSSVTIARGPSPSVGDGQWHSFGSRGNSSVTTARDPSSSWRAGETRSWGGQGHQMPGNNLNSAKFSRSTPPTGASNRGITQSDRRFTEPSPIVTGSTISTSRALSNFENYRFSNSSANRSSFSNSRLGSHVSLFLGPKFGGRHQFLSGERSFGRESSFGGDTFSFFPNLLGLALAFGSFGSRGFGLLGLGLNLLNSGFGGDNGYARNGVGSGGYGDYGGYGALGGYGRTRSPSLLIGAQE